MAVPRSSGMLSRWALYSANSSCRWVGSPVSKTAARWVGSKRSSSSSRVLVKTKGAEVFIPRELVTGLLISAKWAR